MDRRTKRPTRKEREPRLFGLRYQTLLDTFYICIMGAIMVGAVKYLMPDDKPAKKIVPLAHAADFLTKPIPDSLFVKPSPTPLATPTPTEAPSEPWSAFVAKAKEIARIYNYPAKVVIAQAALESGHGGSYFAKVRNNYLGIGAYDEDPNNAYTYENVEQCVISYMELVRKNFPEAWSSRDDPEKLLTLLKYNSNGNMYATDPDYIYKVMNQPEWSQN